MKRNDINTIKEIEPPAYLKEAVLLRVKMAQKRQLRRKKLTFLASLAFSGISLVLSIIFFGKEIINSEFWSLASLGLTDLQIVLQSWQEFGLSLLETFPSLALASLAVPIFMTLVLMKKYSEVQRESSLSFRT